MAAQPPTYRPVWVLVLSSAMLLAAGYSLVAGLLKLRDPSLVLAVGVADTASTKSALVLKKELIAARMATIAPHRRAIQVEAVAQILLALLALYATAAVLARDRHGRALVLSVALLAILYHVGTLPLYLSLMRDYAERSGTLLARAVLQSAGVNPSENTPEELAGRLRSGIVAGTVVMAALGIAGSLVLFAYFGGRRGRALYGLEPAAPRGGGEPPT